MFRIGFGFDTHKLEEGRPFILGGVRIPHHQGPAGHSDADALVHAVIDALLGAAGLPDIGSQFPDTDPAYRGIDSMELLRRTNAMLQHLGYTVGNIDTTVVAQAPRLAPYVPGMKASLAAGLGIDPGQVSVKSKTSEKLGFIGREEGLSAYAIVLLLQLTP